MPGEPRLLPIHIYGDLILRKKAVEVTDFDAELQDFVQDLAHTMYMRDGVGLASPQVGVSKRIVVIDPGWHRDQNPRNPIVMINPVIESSSGETETEEGCISLPDIYAFVVRPSDITVSYTNMQGERLSLKLTGYPAVVVQHEYDHLEGVLFVDHLSTIGRLKLKRRLKELEKTTVDGVNFRSDL